MPTTRPRHTITETEPVQAALDELRRLQGGERLELPDLVIRGAKDKVRELRAAGKAAAQARQEIAEWIRAGDGPKLDIAAVEDAKSVGLLANFDE